jgi:hypothetical protein
MLERELDARDNLTVKVYPTRHGRRITSSSFRVSGVTIDNDPDSLKYTIAPDGQSVEFSAGDAAEDGQVVTGTIEGEQEGVDPGVLKAPFSFTIADVNPDGIDLEPAEPQPDGLGTDGGTAGPAPGPAPEPGGPETGGIDGTSEPAPTAPGGTGTDGTGVGGAEGGTEEPPPPPAPGPGGAPPPPPPPPQPAPMRAPGGPGQTPGPAQVAAPGFRAPNPPPPPPPKPPTGRAPGAGGGPRGR